MKEIIRQRNKALYGTQMNSNEKNIIEKIDPPSRRENKR
jgi:hypothetical protein